MVNLISLTLFLLLYLLFISFYFVFTLTNFADLYFWIIRISVSHSKIMEENVSTLFPRPLEIFSDLSPSSSREVKRNLPFTKGEWENTMNTLQSWKFISIGGTTVQGVSVQLCFLIKKL